MGARSFWGAHTVQKRMGVRSFWSVRTVHNNFLCMERGLCLRGAFYVRRVVAVVLPCAYFGSAFGRQSFSPLFLNTTTSVLLASLRAGRYRQIC